MKQRRSYEGQFGWSKILLEDSIREWVKENSSPVGSDYMARVDELNRMNEGVDFSAIADRVITSINLARKPNEKLELKEGCEECVDSSHIAPFCGISECSKRRNCY